MKQVTVSTMKGVVVNDYGPPENAHVADVEIPKVKDGQLLVRIHAAGVNPFDYKLIMGMAKAWVPLTFPYIPGMDGAGVVAEVGTGVQGWQQGDALLAQFPHGTFAQYALISAKDKKLAKKPDALDFERAAAMPEAGLTAKTMLRAGGVRQGQTVLIVGASGGIGLFATQLAKAGGAQVIATGAAADADYLRRLGADDVIDYKSGDTIAQTRSRHADGVDVVLDVINTGDALIRDAEVLRAGGTIVSSLGGPKQDAFPPGVTVHYIQQTAQDGDLEDLARRAADGTLRVEIGQSYDLSQAAQALADLVDPTKHTRGKLVVRVP
jgi:NADPH:quinone reductase